MSIYKDELNQFSLSQAEKIKLKEAMNKQAPYRSIHMFYRIAGIGAMICITIFCISIFYVINNDQNINNEQISRKEIVSDIMYTPQNYKLSVGGGLGAAAGEGYKTGGDKQEEILLYGGFVSSASQPEQLPVYEYKEVISNGNPVITIQDNEHVIDTISMIADDLKIFANMKMENKKIPIANSNTTVAFRKYSIDDKKTSITNENDGTIQIRSKDIIEDDLCYDVEKMLKLAKTYFNEYKSALPINKPVYHVMKKGEAIQVLITEKQDKAAIYQEGKQYVTFEIKTTTSISNNFYTIKSNPALLLPYQDNLVRVKDMQLMDRKEAEDILVRQGYYYSAYPITVKKEQIIGYDLIYVDGNQYANVAPYRLPCYRFYIKDLGRIIAYDVIAVQQEALRSLDKAIWYMDKKIKTNNQISLN